MRKIIRSLLWVLPFLSFLGGYLALRYLTQAQVVPVPSVVGLHMHDAIKMLSADRLNVRILSEKVDADSEEGIIVSQTPNPGRVVKPHQSIFLVITRRPPKPIAPALFGLSREEAMKRAQQADIQAKPYLLESLQPEGTIIAQNRQIGEELGDKSMSFFVSSGTTAIRIMPLLKGRTIEDVIAFFKPYNITVEVNHPGTEHTCTSCLISDQRPLPGTLVNLKKGFSVQVTAEELS